MYFVEESARGGGKTAAENGHETVGDLGGLDLVGYVLHVATAHDGKIDAQRHLYHSEHDAVVVPLAEDSVGKHEREYGLSRFFNIDKRDFCLVACYVGQQDAAYVANGQIDVVVGFVADLREISKQRMGVLFNQVNSLMYLSWYHQTF